MDENVGRGVSNQQEFDNFSTPAEPEGPIALDRILSAVGNEHRRAVLNSLISTPDRTLGYDALVEHVAERVQREDTERKSDEHHQRIRIVLHHTHLPKLDEVGIIDYEGEAGHVQFIGGELEQDLLTLVEYRDNYE